MRELLHNCSLFNLGFSSCTASLPSVRFVRLASCLTHAEFGAMRAPLPQAEMYAWMSEKGHDIDEAN